MDMSRRTFLGTAAASTTAIAAMGALNLESQPALAEEAPLSFDAEEECDVAVVGVGCAGISACVEAAEMGVKVVGFDRATSVAATNACMVVGIYGVGDPEAIGPNFTYMSGKSNYQFNNRILRRYLEIIDGQCQRYMDKGVEMRRVESDPSKTESGLSNLQYMFAARGLDRGDQFSAMLATYDNLTLCWETQVTKILMEDGKAVGLLATGPDGVVTKYNVKGGIIVCTGGFGANEEVARARMGGAYALITGSIYNDGSGIAMMQEAGAQLGKNFAFNATEGGALNPKASCGNTVMSPMYNGMLRATLMGDVLLNKRGERFVDEAIMCKKTMMFCSEPVTREGCHFYAIMPQTEMDMLKTMTLAEFCEERYGFTITHGMIKKFLAANPIEHFDEDAQTAIDEGWCWKGNTFKELEEASGIPNIEATMEEYNAMCEAGEDGLFFKDPAFLKPYTPDDAPFYLIECYMGQCCTQGGISTDGNCRALTPDRDVIEGLYAAGMDADLESVPYIIGATCHGFSIGSGYIAAEDAAKRALA